MLDTLLKPAVQVTYSTVQLQLHNITRYHRYHACLHGKNCSVLRHGSACPTSTPRPHATESQVSTLGH